MTNRIIGHLDMDAFFASVEEKTSPLFKNKPIVIGSDPKDGKGRGVVSTANYKAREYGIHSALPVSQAWKLAEQAKAENKEETIFLIPNMELYEKTSKRIFVLIKKYAQLVEPASIDEFYFDLCFAKSYKQAEAICKKIKQAIYQQEKITCSIGLGPNKLIAKMSAGVNKPDGLKIVKPNQVSSFLEPLAIRKIPGIGPKTAEFLYKQNILTIKDLKKVKKEKLKAILHRPGELLYNKARGRDDSLIVEGREIKSISEQATFEKNTLNSILISEQLNILCEHVLQRFKKEKFIAFKTMAIVVRFSNFTTQSSAKSFKENLSYSDLKKFKLEALKLILPFFDKRKNPKLYLIRLIGLRIEKFTYL